MEGLIYRFSITLFGDFIFKFKFIFTALYSLWKVKRLQSGCKMELLDEKNQKDWNEVRGQS